ncbi:NADPH-dependent diflavin oxidoreductase 1 [Fulvia fulva]|nr:NADPH-dependent diflavin oxidoreductase 1 [Fulvia fulva]
MAPLLPSRTALVLYGSETGNAQDVAEEVGCMAERLRFDTTVLDLDSVQLKDITKPTVVIFALSTTGQGEMPQNARAFWQKLLSSALTPGIMRKVHFTSFGLGDSSYAQYNVAHRMLHGRLVQLGAKPFCERGEGNEQHPEGHSAGFREWIVTLRSTVLDCFPLPDGTEPVPDDVFIEPKWKLDLELEANGNGTESGSGTGDDSNELPSTQLLPVRDAHTTSIDRNERITAKDHFQDVRLLDLRVQEAVSYGPGAVAVVYPKNFPCDVNSFIDLMGWQNVADKPLRLVTSDSRAGEATSTPSPLRYLDLSSSSLTIRWLLENVLDIMSIPRRSFFAGLAHLVGEDDEDEAYQRERLLELANPELIDELWDYTTRPKRTILEAMTDFTLVKIPWQYALSILPIMRGRQFSIASGGDLIRDDEGRTRIQLLIAIVDPPSPIIKYRRRYGVCTRYVTALEAKQQIKIGIHSGYLDVQPSELQSPVVMVGPGTGLAPMRSMAHQRLAWARDDSKRSAHSLDGDMLFFGCRSENADYFFRDEWDRFATNDGLAVCTAFSRDKDKPKEYVQDQIRVNGKAVCDALVRKNGKVYVCGSSGNMPKGVRQALLDVLVEHKDGMSMEEAETYLDLMEKNGRYKQETCDDHYGLTVRISIGKDVITLPEDDQTAFTLFRRWLYAPGRRMTAPAAILRHEYKNFDYDTLAKLWCFAALRIIPMLQNRAIDLIIAKMAAGDKMSTSTLRHVSTESSNDSPLRKLVVFYNAHHQCFEMSDDMKKDELSSDGWFGKFSTETMLERATGLPVDTTSYRNQAATWFRCTYHVHERGAKCGSMGWNQS